MFPKVPLIQLEDYDLQQMQQGLNERLNLVSAVPFLDGRLIENLALTVGNNTIEHKLGREYQGYFFTKMSAASQVYDATTAAADSALNLVLNASANVTVNLWVF